MPHADQIRQAGICQKGDNAPATALATIHLHGRAITKKRGRETSLYDLIVGRQGGGIILNFDYLVQQSRPDHKVDPLPLLAGIIGSDIRLSICPSNYIFCNRLIGLHLAEDRSHGGHYFYVSCFADVHIIIAYLSAIMKIAEISFLAIRPSLLCVQISGK